MSLTSWWWIWQHVRRWGWRDVNQFLKIYALWIQYNKLRVLSIWQATPVLPATPSVPIAGSRVSGWRLRSRNLLLPTRKQYGVENEVEGFFISQNWHWHSQICAMIVKHNISANYFDWKRRLTRNLRYVFVLKYILSWFLCDPNLLHTFNIANLYK